MSAEERALRAIEVTRSTLIRAMNDPEVLMMMVIYATTPETIEDRIAEILAYLDMTGEEERPRD